MNDFLSFFRFVLPGIVYFGLLLLSTFLYDKPYLFDVLRNKELVSSIGTLIGIFIISGGLGYVFSLIYRFIFPVHGFNQVKVVNDLCEAELIEISLADKDNKPFKIENDDRRGKIRAYEIVNIIWHLNHKYFDGSKTEFQASIINALGATLIACFFSVFSFLLLTWRIYQSPSSYFNFILPLFVLIGFLCFVCYQYMHSSKMYERWVNSTFVSVVIANTKGKKETIIGVKDEEIKTTIKDQEFISKIRFIE